MNWIMRYRKPYKPWFQRGRAGRMHRIKDDDAHYLCGLLRDKKLEDDLSREWGEDWKCQTCLRIEKRLEDLRKFKEGPAFAA